MEGLVRLVTQSLERHGLTVPPARIDWSPWLRLESSLSLTAPSNPGVFVVAEAVTTHNVLPPSEELAAELPKNKAQGVSRGEAIHAIPEGRKTQPPLAVLNIGHTNDLGVEISRLCFHSPFRDRIALNRCLIRFAAVDDESQRLSASAALQQWFASPETSGLNAEPLLATSALQPTLNYPAPLPSGF